MDLIGVDAQTGLGINASFTVHTISTGNLYCGDGTVYLYGTLELDTDTAFGKFLNSVMHVTCSWDFYDEKSSPLKLKLHIENGHRVDACTFGVGGLNGYVKDNETGNVISDARVLLYQGDNLVKTLYSDNSGKFLSTNMSAGDYTLKVSATGYNTYSNTITISANQTTYVETLLMTDRSYNGEFGNIYGDIMDAVTGEYIGNVTYKVRKNWNNTSGDVIESGTTDSASNFSVDLETGNYTIEFIKDQYTSTSVNIAIQSNSSTENHIAMSPENYMNFEDGVRIVLTWDKYPLDIDSHLYGPTVDGNSTFHICYWNKDYYYNSETIVNLDRDDIDSYGPETTTIYSLNSNGIYSFYVYDYSNQYQASSTALSSSGAVVRVYNGNQLIARYNVPINNEGTLWHVFDYNASTGEPIAINTFSYCSDPGGTLPDAVNVLSVSPFVDSPDTEIDVSELESVMEAIEDENIYVEEKILTRATYVLENPLSQELVDNMVNLLYSQLAEMSYSH